MSWTHYIIQVNIYLVIFYGFYKLLLDKETYFTLNRIYLVSAGIFSLAIPFLRFEWFTKQPVAQPVYIGVDQLNQFIQTTVISQQQEAPEIFTLANLVILLYIAGVLFCLTKLIIQLVSVNKILKKKQTGAAFSFFQKKMVDKALPQSNTINKHEDIHIRQLHTLDILFFEILAAITWFNPIIYFYKNTVRNIHEYLADEEAAKFQGDKEQYSLLLLSNAFGVAPSTLTNNFFNKSLIKKRIFMLHKQRSRKTAFLKYGLFVPLFAVTLVMSSATIRNNEKIQAVADRIPMEEPLNIVKEAVTESMVTPVQIAISSNEPKAKKQAKPVKKSIKPVQVEELATANEGWKDFYSYVQKTTRYTPVAQKSKIQGSTMVKFTVLDGQLDNVGIVTKLGGGCDAELMRVVVSYPGYETIKDGKYTLEISFVLEGANTPMLNENILPLKGYIALNKVTVTAYGGPPIAGRMVEDTKVYEFMSLQTQPTFPGGMEKFYSYLNKAVRYPEMAQKNNIQGKVFLSFVVEKDGTLTDIKVNRKLGAGTDEEAVRVLKASPKWIPGTLNGNTVRVQYNIPISFSLTGDERKSLIRATKVTDLYASRDVKANNLIVNLVQTPARRFIVNGEKMNNFSKTSSIRTEDLVSLILPSDKDATAKYVQEAKNGVVVIQLKHKDAVNGLENPGTLELKRINK